MDREKEIKRKAWITAILSSVGLLVLFYFLVAWAAPDPPNPEYGIELSLSASDFGGGAEPATNDNPVKEEVQPTSDPTSTDAPTEPEVTPTDSKLESDVPVQEKTAKQPTEQKVEKKEPTVNKDALYDPTKKDGSKKEGKDNPDAVYSGKKGGGGDGSSLNMAGWVWDSVPNPKDTSSETGKIVYEITVDGDGYIVPGGVRLISSTVSGPVERVYRSAVEKLSFTKTSDYKAAPVSKGQITFIIKSK